MKNIYHAIVLLLISFSNTYAQNWECIKTDDEYYYGESGPIVVISETIRIDSIYSEFDNVIYRNHKAIDKNSSCNNPNGPSFLGKKAFSDNAGYFHFINQYNDTLHIKSTARKDENWVFYLKSSSNIKIIAHIDTIVFDSSLLLPDSVKIIGFYAQNMQGDMVEHEINNKTISLGKNHGFLSLFDYRISPYFIMKYSLVGTKTTKKGYGNFGADEIWNMEIGDEFHFIESVSSSSCPTTNYYIRKVLDKHETGNILNLDFIEWAFHSGGVLCSGDEYYPARHYTETINFENPLVKRWNSLPGESYVANLNGGYFTIYSSRDTLLQEKRHSFPPLLRSDTTSNCFHVDIDPSGWNGYDYAIKGAGGYYFRGNISWGYEASIDFSCKYFKKGNKIYGDPFDYGHVIGWWPFNTSRTFYWGRNLDNNTTIAEQTVKFKPLSHSHINSHFYTVGLANETCWNHKKIGIFGKDILSDQGNYYMVNYSSDTILFKIDTRVNQEWFFYRNEPNNLIIKAKCQSQVKTTVFSMVDSLRSYTFQAYDLNGIPIDHPVNNKEIALSKNCGFLSTFDFYYFPDSLDSQNYTLNGYYEWHAEQGNINRNLTLAQVYEMQVGDRIDLVNTTTFEGGQTVTETIKYLIAKTGSSLGTLNLDFRILSKITTYYDQGDSTIQYLQDTITQSIDFTDDFTTQFNKEVGDLMVVDGGYKIARLEKSSSLYNGRLMKEINPVIYTSDNPSDSCYTATTLDCGYYYINNLGGPYEKCTNGSFISIDRVVSYQSSGNIWGSPLNESDVLGFYTELVEPFITVYPNPAKNKLNIRISDKKNTHWTLEILNSVGKQLIIVSLSEVNNEVNIEKFASGIYIYRLISKDGSSEGKFLKR